MFPPSSAAIRQAARCSGRPLRLEWLEHRRMLSGATPSPDRYEADDTPAQAKAISTTGSLQTHSLHTAADVDWAKFTLAAPSYVTIETGGTAGDTEITLYGPNSATAQIAYDNDSGWGYFSRIVRTGTDALVAGTYYVKVNEYGRNAVVNAYTLRVTADSYEADDTAAQAKTISTAGSLQTHSLHAAADVDWAKFTLAAPSYVTIETGGAAGDTELWLYGPNSATSQIAYDNDSGPGAFSRIVRTGVNALAAGTYYVKVGEYGKNSVLDTYTLRVTADSYEVDDTAAQAKAISTTGSLQTHSLHTATDTDWVKFTLAAKSYVTIETGGTAGDTELWLYGPNSATTQIAYDNDSGPGSFSRIMRTGVNALAAGTYYVKVNEYGRNAVVDTYTLRVTADPYEVDDTAAQAKTISTTGSVQTHSLHTATDTDWVKFTLAAKSYVMIETGGTAGDTEITLFGPNSTTAQIAYDNDSGPSYFSRIVRTGVSALAAGTYYLKVNEYGRNAVVDTYTLRVTADPYEVDDTAAQAKAISTTGSLQTHSLHTAVDTDWAKFTLAAKSDVTIETGGTAGDTEITLFGPNSTTAQIAYDNDSGPSYFSRIVRTGVNALAAGTYYLKVNEYGRNAAVDTYTLRVAASAAHVAAPGARETFVLPGVSLSATAPTSVLLTDSDGLSVTLSAVQVAAASGSSSVTFSVPVHVDAATLAPTAGTVGVRIQQQTATGLVTYDVGTLQVLALPETGLAPGTLVGELFTQSLEQVTAELRDLQAIAGAAGSSVDASPVLTQLQAEKEHFTEIQQYLRPLIDGEVEEVVLGQFQGSDVALNADSLGLMDRLIAGMVLGRNTPTAAATSASESPQPAAAGVDLLGAVRDLFEDIQSNPEQAIEVSDHVGEWADAVGAGAKSILALADRVPPGTTRYAKILSSLGTGVSLAADGASIAMTAQQEGLFQTIQDPAFTLEDFRRTKTAAKVRETLVSAETDLVIVLAGELIGGPPGLAIASAIVAGRHVYDAMTKGTTTTEALTAQVERAFTTIRAKFTSPTIQVSPQAMEFEAAVGGASSASQTLTVENTGWGALHFSVSPSLSQIHVSPSSGTLNPGESASIEVYAQVPNGSLQVGSQTATIEVSDPGATNPTETIDVTLNVISGKISRDPIRLSFTAKRGETPAAQTLSVQNVGKQGTYLHYQMEQSSGVTVSGTKSSALPAGQKNTFQVSVSTAGLEPGTYTKMIDLSNDDDPGDVATVTVVITITGEAAADLWATLDSIPASVRPGDTFTITGRYGNHGPGAASNVTLMLGTALLGYGARLVSVEFSPYAFGTMRKLNDLAYVLDVETFDPQITVIGTMEISVYNAWPDQDPSSAQANAGASISSSVTPDSDSSNNSDLKWYTYYYGKGSSASAAGAIAASSAPAASRDFGQGMFVSSVASVDERSYADTAARQAAAAPKDRARELAIQAIVTERDRPLAARWDGWEDAMFENAFHQPAWTVNSRRSGIHDLLFGRGTSLQPDYRSECGDNGADRPRFSLT